MKKTLPKLPANLRGKYVSRAAFAKLQAEKHRLMNDIKLMTRGGAEGGIVWIKWRRHFKSMAELGNMLREIAKEELPKLQEKYGTLPKIDKNPKAFKQPPTPH